MTLRYSLLMSLAASAACAGGSTMRVAPEEGQENTPVALTPAPESAADSTVQSTPPAAPDSSGQDTAHAGQGYSAYGNSGTLQIRRVGQWTHTGIREARRMVIQDANTWAAFWSELGVGDRPGVDFSRDIVIAVAAGQRSSGGHEIAVTGVTQTNGELTAEVLETAPGPNCLTTSALTQPVDVVVVQGIKPRSWSFVEQKEVRDCRP